MTLPAFEPQKTKLPPTVLYLLSALRSLDPVSLLLHILQEVQYMYRYFKKLTDSYHLFHQPSLTALVQIQGD